MEVRVYGLSGALACTTHVHRSDTVSILKQQIRDVTGIRVPLQKLIFANETLRDNASVTEVLPEGIASDILLVQVDVWIDKVGQDWKLLRKAPPHIRNDHELILNAVERSQGAAIKYAGDGPRSDPDIMMAAMKFDGSFCRYAKEPLCTEKAFVMAALQLVSTGYAGTLTLVQSWLWNAPVASLADREFMLLAVQHKGALLKIAHESLRADRDLVVAAVAQDPFALLHAATHLLADHDLVHSAVVRATAIFQHAADELQADREFVLSLIRNGAADAVRFASDELRASREVMMAAVQSSGACFKVASEQLRGDKDFVVQTRHRCPLQFASAELRADRDLLSQFLECGKIDELRHASEQLRGDKRFMIEALPHLQAYNKAHQTELVFPLAPALLADREMMLDVIRVAPYMFERASEVLRADPALVLEIVRCQSLMSLRSRVASCIAEPLRSNCAGEIAGCRLPSHQIQQHNWLLLETRLQQIQQENEMKACICARYSLSRAQVKVLVQMSAKSASIEYLGEFCIEAKGPAASKEAETDSVEDVRDTEPPNSMPSSPFDAARARRGACNKTRKQTQKARRFALQFSEDST